MTGRDGNEHPEGPPASSLPHSQNGSVKAGSFMLDTEGY